MTLHPRLPSQPVLFDPKAGQHTKLTAPAAATAADLHAQALAASVEQAHACAARLLACLQAGPLTVDEIAARYPCSREHAEGYLHGVPHLAVAALVPSGKVVERDGVFALAAEVTP